MRVLLSAGGTLGHIKPAIIMGKYLKRHGHQVLLITTRCDHFKKELITSYIGNNYIELECYGLKNLNIKKVKTNILAYYKVKKIVKEKSIDKALGFGGYISGIASFAANKLKVDTYIHEQNSILGKSNYYLSHKVKKIFLSIPIKQCKKGLVVGNPVYDDVKEIATKNYHLKKQILFTSGSLGAQAINQLAVDFINSNFSKDYLIIIVTGRKYYEEVKKNIKKDEGVIIYKEIDNLIPYISSSSIVVSRAGASTLYEILACNTKAILIPSPNVVKNHQEKNAIYFKKIMDSLIICEKDLTLSFFYKSLKDLELKKNNQQSININPCLDMMEEMMK